MVMMMMMMMMVRVRLGDDCGRLGCPYIEEKPRTCHLASSLMILLHQSSGPYDDRTW